MSAWTNEADNLVASSTPTPTLYGNGALMTDSYSRTASDFEPSYRKQKKPNLCLLIALVLALAALMGLCGGIIGRLLSCQQGRIMSENEVGNAKEGPICDKKVPDLNAVVTEIATTLEPLPTSEEPTEMYRIPRHLKPEHYDLTFVIGDNMAFIGTTSILLYCELAVNEIELHAVGFAVREVRLHSAQTGETIELWDPPYVINHKTETIVILVRKQLSSNQLYILDLDYEAKLCNNSAVACLEDFYPIYFATKFEPAYARHFYPCFDEPDIKATYNTTVLIPESWTNVSVLSNEAISALGHEGGWTRIRFRTTPRMSTYVFALVLGVFESHCKVTQAGLPICVYMDSKMANSIPFALENAVTYFDVVSAKFKPRYPLTKLEFVGIRGYKTAAMEHWGLIVHNAYTLVTYGNDGVSQDLSKEHLAIRVLTHELVHQWFGNLVTMKWWDDIWLNEGFAQHFAYDFLLDLHPMIVETGFQRALVQLMDLQAEPGQQVALRRNFSSPYSLSAGFQGTGYFHLYIKGAATVRLIQEIMTRDRLIKNLGDYLEAYAYDAANSQDLWKYLNYETHGRKLGEIMDSWLNNPGLPEIHVIRDYSSQRLEVRQATAMEDNYKHFIPGFNKSSGSSIWTIPVVWRTSLAPRVLKTSWLSNKTSVFSDSNLNPEGWLIANPEGQYPYRVNYDLENWRRLIHQLKRDREQLSPISRAHLISNSAFYFMYNQNITVFLELCQYLRYENHPLPWLIATSALKRMFSLYRATLAMPALQLYFQPIIAQLESLLRADAHTEQGTLLRDDMNTICLLSCATGQQSCEKWGFNQSAFAARSDLFDPKLSYSPCWSANFCHRIRHNLYPEDMEIAKSMLQRERPDHATIQLSYKELLCSTDQSFLQSLLEYDSENIALGLESLYYSLTLEHQPVAFRLLTERAESTHLFFAHLGTVDESNIPFIKQKLRAIAAGPYEVDKLYNLMPLSVHPLLEEVKLEYEWADQSAPAVAKWLWKQIT